MKTTIIHEAIRIFAEKGYTETTIRDITSACGLQPASFYSHYESKQDLLALILQMYSQNTRDRTSNPEEMDRLIEQTDAKVVLERLFFTFSEEADILYRRILKIMLQEQYRNEYVRAYMRDIYAEKNRAQLEYVLNRLVELEKIRPVNTRVYAELFSALNIRATIVSAYYEGIEEAYRDKDRWLESIRFLIAQIVGELPEEVTAIV